MHHLIKSLKIATPYGLKWGKRESELGGSVNNHSLKKMDQAYIQIK